MIEVHGLQKRFGATQALNGISFSAKNGSITGLLGANGAGKTTCLRIIAGALAPDAGMVTVDAPLGSLLDHIGLYARLTVRENLAYFGELHRISPAQLNLRIDQILSKLNLQEVADRRAGSLSLGQSTKAALGRALIHNPSNILLDEPTNGLDVPAVRSLRTHLCDLRAAGACIVFSSHVLDEVRALCDSLVIMARGSVVACGSPDEICHQAGSDSLEEAFIILTGSEEHTYA
jgi:sodium transport system ATP-binding protein